MNNLDKRLVFRWWVGFAIKKHDRLIKSASNKRYHKRMHKFGIEVPKSIKVALDIDRRTNTTYWRDGLKLEMDNVIIAFDILADGDELPVGYQQIKCHMIFDIKMGSLQRKCRLVAGGHMTNPPSSITYASVF